MGMPPLLSDSDIEEAARTWEKVVGYETTPKYVPPEDPRKGMHRTFAEIGAELGLSTQATQQICARALRKCKRYLVHNYPGIEFEDLTNA